MGLEDAAEEELHRLQQAAAELQAAEDRKRQAAKQRQREAEQRRREEEDERRRKAAAAAAERIAEIEEELHQEVERQMGLEALAGVMADSDEFDDQAREQTDANLDKCRQRIEELEEELVQLEATVSSAISDDEGDDEDMLGGGAGGGDAAADAEARRLKKANKRKNVLEEMIKTEEEFVQDLRLCMQGYLTSDSGLHSASAPAGIDVDKLFGNFEQVIELATLMFDQLSDQQDKAVEQQCVGAVFVQQASELMDVYVKYCCNFEDASVLVNDYTADPEKKAYFASLHESINAYTNCWDLGSFLIKPVQRILKYPLLLKELMDCTEDSHPDHKQLMEATVKMADVATAINEGKRRKELVTRYQSVRKKKDEGNVGFDKMNWHSTRKKTMRLNQKIYNRVLAKEDEQNFPGFAKEEKCVRDLEQACKKLRKRCIEQCDALKATLEAQTTLSTSLKVCGDFCFLFCLFSVWFSSYPCCAA